MKYQIKTEDLNGQTYGSLILGIFESSKLPPEAATIDKASNKQISNILKSGDFSGKLGETLTLRALANVQAERVILVGCGKKEQFNESHYLKAVAAANASLHKTGSKNALSTLNSLPVQKRDNHWKIQQALQLTDQHSYQYTETKSKKPNKKAPLNTVSFFCNDKSEKRLAQKAVKQGQAISNGMTLAKDLANAPGNICTPSYLAKTAKALAKEFTTVKTTVLGEKEVKALKMGSFLSVAKGSDEPLKFIVIEHNGAKTKSEKPHVLVGKGITFDSGGISIKPGPDMDQMKFDMCGAATVIGTMRAVAELNLPINIVALVPSCENLPSGRANKPGDVVTSMSGQTIEVLNTDAEGRLILCDALTYAKRYKPKSVIDVATLTGACVIALGSHATGLMSNNEKLTDTIKQASNDVYDRVWQLPLWDDYQQQLDSNFADMANIGGREAGTITAGCFLSRYAEAYPWAHLDIAGTAWKSGKDKGASGRPVPLLTQYLINQS